MNPEAERVTWGQMMPRAVKVGAVVAVLALVVGMGVLRWWPTRDVEPPSSFEIGFTSDDMESLWISTPLESGQIFRCTPGALDIWMGFGASESMELVDVSMPWFDDTWSDFGWAERTATEVMRDPHGDLDDMEDFTGWQLSPEGDPARMKLTWEITECPQMDAITWVDQVEVTYRVDGRTHLAQVPMLEPFRMTTQNLDRLAEQVTVERR